MKVKMYKKVLAGVLAVGVSVSAMSFMSCDNIYGKSEDNLSIVRATEANDGESQTETETESESPEPEEVSLKNLSGTKTKIYAGFEGAIKYEASAKPDFVSSDSSIVKIDQNGEYVAKRQGKAVITVSLGDKSFKHAIYVKEEKLAIQGKSEGTIYISKGMVFQVTTKSKDYSNLQSSDKSVAKVVSSKGKYYIKAKKEGTAVISIANAVGVKLKVKVVENAKPSVALSSYMSQGYGTYLFSAYVDNKSKSKIKLLSIEAAKDTSGKEFKGQPKIKVNKTVSPGKAINATCKAGYSNIKRIRIITKYVNVNYEYKGYKYKAVYEYDTKKYVYKIKKTIIL